MAEVESMNIQGLKNNHWLSYAWGNHRSLRMNFFSIIATLKATEVGIEYH